MPGSTPTRSSLIPLSERQQLKLVRQLEIKDRKRGSPSCMKELGQPRVRTKSCNGRGETPLHKAAIKGDEDLVTKLLAEGADPNIPDFAGWTPLHEACNHGWYKVALALIEAGASVNARGFDDDTPLHDAAVNGHTKLVQLLVEKGADVNSRNKVGKTPRDVAAPSSIPHLVSFCSPESETIEMNSRRDRDEPTAASESSETTPQSKVDKNSKETLKLSHATKKSALKLEKKFLMSSTMEEKSNKEDVYEFKSSKEATPVRGTSASPEAEKTNAETKTEKSGEGAAAAGATATTSSSEAPESAAVKRTMSEATESEEAEDETKRKKRKESDGKVREEGGTTSKGSGSGGRAAAVRNVGGGAEKTGKVAGHVACKNSAPASKQAASGSNASASAERKSPGSPKGAAAPVPHPSASGPASGGAGKPDAETEEKSLADGDKMDQGPKVPPLKIVIPQQTASEPEQGNRNGKNGASRHHQALPYVVSSNSNDGEKEGLRSRSASPTDSFKAEEKKDPAIGMLSAEDQKGALHHQRVLRSAHRTGPNNNGENRTSETSTSRSGSSANQSAGNVSSAAPASAATNANSGGTAAADNPSPQSQNRTSPSPQVDSNPATGASAQASSEGAASAQTSSNHRASSAATPGKGNGNSSNSTAASTYDDKVPEGSTESSAAPQPAIPVPAPVELHPRKRKLKHNKEVKEPALPQAAAERSESAAVSTEVHPHEQPVKNCYQLFLDIRKQIERRRKGLFPVQPKPPQGFKDYLMNRCTYVLAGNASTRQIPTSPLPQNLSSPMKELFAEQEKERHRLRLQHVIEKEKLVLSVEQEILRVHGRAARALANQSLPFSACTILKDEEVYNLITPEQEEKDRNARSRYNGRLFLSWLQDVDDKWEKIKEAMLLRHHNEAESLHAVQKMDWEWKMKESGSCEFKSKPVILESHVPMVHVSDDFDLLPA